MPLAVKNEHNTDSHLTYLGNVLCHQAQCGSALQSAMLDHQCVDFLQKQLIWQKQLIDRQIKTMRGAPQKRLMRYSSCGRTMR